MSSKFIQTLLLYNMSLQAQLYSTNMVIDHNKYMNKPPKGSSSNLFSPCFYSAIVGAGSTEIDGIFPVNIAFNCRNIARISRAEL